ncbi:MAG: DNA replication/repair protein RecF [Actinomycetota bacterium]|nr:DNA replication/repair protein RecF [Actinomycetota bacterium]
MHVARLTLQDFRSYRAVELTLGPGVTAFVGPNGQGKTNLVEAVDYVATLGSHRAGSDTPLVRAGAERAVVRLVVVRDERPTLVEVEVNPGSTNRARVNRSPLPRSREVLGLLRTVLFSPDDLALVKGDPSGRRRFLDELLVAQAPRYAGVRQDYDRVLRQRNSLLKTAGAARRAATDPGVLRTLEVWDTHLSRTGAELLAGRLRLVQELQPHVSAAYARVALQAATGRDAASLAYQPSLELPADVPAGASPGPAVRPVDRDVLVAALLAEVARRRADELDRGVSLVGPHRDDLALVIGSLPARGYASQGESWSLALALRLASYDLLRSTGDEPVLILDDVFAELDADRRDRLAELVGGAEQVLLTAAVAADVPDKLDGARFDVTDGGVRRVC